MAGLLLPPPPAARCFAVAASGGRDSTVLVHALQAAGLPLRVLHVHHGLQPAADAFAAQVAAQCAAMGLPCQRLDVRVVDDGHGPEAAARAARYAALWSALAPGEVLVTAHHAADLAETLILRLRRGTGLEGLAAMQVWETTPRGPLWRPLLGLAPAVLERYAAEQGLRWCEDPHNRDPRYARVRLRRQLMPALRATVPDLDARLGALAAAMARVRAGLAPLRVAALATACHPETRWGPALSIPALREASPGLYRFLLRAYAEARMGLPPSQAQLARLAHELIDARADAQPRLQQGDWVWRRYRDALYLLRRPPPRPASLPDWPAGARQWTCPGLGRWTCAEPPSTPLQLRWPQGGERLQPAGGTGRRRLSALYQTAGVPPWVRQRRPLLWQGDRLLAVADLVATAEAPAGLSWQSADAAEPG